MKTIFGKKQKGAAAIEFALVFLIFFAVLYGVLSYSLPLLLVQSFNNATAEAVRRSMAVDPTAAGYDETVKAFATGVLGEKLDWVPDALQDKLVLNVGYQDKVLTASVSLPATALTSIMPVLKLGIITVPNLPDALEAQSSAQLVP